MEKLKRKQKSLQTKNLILAGLLIMAWCFAPCSLLAQGGYFNHQSYGNDVYIDFTHQPFGNLVGGGFTHQPFGNDSEGDFTHQSFGNGVDGGFTHQSFGNGMEGGFTHQGFGNDVNGGFLHQPFGYDAPMGGGWLILLSAGVGYAAMKKKKFEKK